MRIQILKIYRLGLKQAKISAVVQPISGVVMLLTIAIILGFGALEIGTEQLLLEHL